MQPKATMTSPSNPLARLADAIPEMPAFAASIVARIIGAGAALFYAYDQDTLFPSRHFPRTWVFCSVAAAIVILSILPWERLLAKPALATFLGALGGGILVFAGANLSHKPVGVLVLISGVVAWLAFAAVSHQRKADPGSLVSGLFMGSLVSFLLVGACVLLVGG